MPHQNLNRTQIGPSLEMGGRKTVTKRVRGYPFVQSCGLSRSATGFLDRSGMSGSIPVTIRKQPAAAFWAVVFVVRAQCFQQPWR